MGPAAILSHSFLIASTLLQNKLEAEKFKPLLDFDTIFFFNTIKDDGYDSSDGNNTESTHVEGKFPP